LTIPTRGEPERKQKKKKKKNGPGKQGGKKKESEARLDNPQKKEPWY